VLSQRVAIPPPTQFHAIADGKIVSQPAAGRTANLVSRAEHPPAASEDDDSDASPMEEAFMAALGEDELPPPEHQVFIDQLEERRAGQTRTIVSKEEVNHANEPHRTGGISR
jgi:hypothetical protein